MASDLIASDSRSAAAEVQERVLGFRLADHSEQLAELRRQTYESQSHQTQAETARYPISIKRFDGPDAVSQHTDVLLIDCDGRIADRLLSSKSRAQEPGAVGAEVSRADSVIFVIDASAGPGRIEADLHAAAGFL